MRSTIKLFLTYILFLGLFHPLRPDAIAWGALEANRLVSPSSEKVEADRLFELAGSYNGREEYSLALELYQEALQIYQQIGDRQHQEYCLYNIGAIYLRQGNYQQALQILQQTLNISREISSLEGEWRVLTLIGAIYGELGEYAQALTAQEQALNIAQNLNSPSKEQSVLVNLGSIYSYLGQYDQALEIFRQALSLTQRSAERNTEGQTLESIGLVYLRMENYEQSINHYQQALYIYQEISNQYEQAGALNSLGDAYNRIGRSEQALRLLEQALSIAQNLGDRDQIAYILDTLGSTYAALGQFDRAWNAYQQALAILIEIGNRSEQINVLSNMGDLLVQQNQPELAIVFYKESVNVTESIRREIQGLSIEQQQSYTNTIADTYRKLADLLLQQDRILEAQQVLDLLRVQEIQDYLRQRVRGTEQTAEGIFLLEAEERVFVRFDRLLEQGRRLTELQAIALETGNLTAEQQAELQELYQTSDQVGQAFNDFLDLPEVQLARQQLRTNVPQALNFDALNSIGSNLAQSGRNAVLLYPFVLDDRLELVLLSPHSPPMHQTVPVTRVELNRAISDFLTVLKDPNSDARPTAERLYNWLIRPIEPFLTASGAEVVLYAPDQQLRYIPLAALYDGEQWFVEKFQINQLTAVSLTNFNTPSRAQPRILAGAFSEGRYTIERQIGGQRYPQPFDGLPFTRVEVQTIASLFPNTRQLIDQEFSENATLPFLNSYNIIHFATHAMFTTGAPEDSFIVLGNGDTIDLNEVRRLHLTNVDLVVLSSCQTGVSAVNSNQDLGSGVEILGFGYQWQNAGARAAIASLWRVDDGGTEALMSQFYSVLQQDNLSKAFALQQAQIALIRGSQHPQLQDTLIQQHDSSDTLQIDRQQLTHPYYWAPFILIGNGL